MSWYWLVPLIYVVCALVTFRFAFLDELEDYQREMHEWKMTPAYSRTKSMSMIDADHKFSLAFVGLVSGFWPVTLVCVVVYLLSKGVFWLMFPRGIKTKFDREQQLEREKKEAERKFNEARELLAQEGIKV